ncbi:MAG: MlaD family protein [Betaproteobacteria bacterium]|jgi:phospholipid/cholesterol/gamma-HCH transport system substrate-binding protein
MTPKSEPSLRHLELKAALLLALLSALLVAAVLYVLYARGLFEDTRTLVLRADNAEGVVPGMDLSFAGFPIGRVRSLDLAPDNSVRIMVDVAEKDAHRLRTSSVFTLSRGLFGGASLRAFTGVPDDPPLPDGAERPVLIGDATAEIPRLLADARELVSNLNALTGPESALAASLANVQAATARLNGRQGALGVLLGNEADARRVATALDRINALLARADALVAHADTQVFGRDGLVPEVQATVAELRTALTEARGSLRKIDALLTDVQAIAGSTRDATTDLAALRTEVDASLRKVGRMIDELNRRWPFARDAAIELP